MRADEQPHGAPESTAARRLHARALIAGGVLLASIIAGCAGASPVELPDPAQMIRSGSWYVREPWPHDGHPYETEHFVVYSDGAGLEARQRLGTLAEEVWVEVIDVMGLDPATMFKFPPGQDKIDLYASRYHALEGGGARAYYAGIIIPSFDNETGASTSAGSIRINLKHELVHVAEALLKGRFVGDVAVSDPRRMPVWFSEGTAEALSGGSTGGAPRTLDRVDGLIARFGRINPIAWRVDLPMSEAVLDAYPHYYYPMAHLAVGYLLDPKGMNRSPEDLAAVMLDMGNDVSFDQAFEDHIGIGQDDYEERFFALMQSYLPQSEFPFEAVALGMLSLLAAGVMGGSLAWGVRSWPSGVSAASRHEEPVWSRRARRGFIAEVSVLASAVVGLVAVALFAIGFDDLPADANRTLGHAVVGGYFIGSAGILMWAVRRWAGRSRLAYLIPLLVIVATLITIVLIDLIF